MKKLYKPICFIAAVAAMSLTSCQKESFTPGSEEGTVITVHATVEDVANASKTHIDGTQVYWDQDEQMRIVSFDEANAASNNLSEGFTPSADYTTATFTVNINTEGKTMIAGVYPASAAVDDNKYANKYKMILPASQQPTADSYDPAAYIMITKAESLPLQNNEWNASYIRAAALTRMEVSGLNDDIKSVTVTFPENQYAAGRRYFDLATGEAGEIYTDKTNIITISYSEPLAAGTTRDVWFTSWNVDVAQGETVTVKVQSDTKTYTKTFTATKSISLKENFLNIMPIDMTGATVEDINPAEDYSGEYLIIAKGNDNWVYMSSYNDSKSVFDGTDSSIPSSRDYSTLTMDDFTGADEYVWTLTKISNNLYTLYNAALKYYLDLSADDTDVKLSDSAVNHEVTINDKGAYQINYINSTRSLKGNPLSSGYRFANYVTTGTQNDIYLLPWVESTEPLLTVSQPEQTVAAGAESVSFTYVAKNITGEITAVEGTDADNIISAVSVDKASSTVNVTLNPNTEEVEKTATITLSAEGVDPITLTITQAAYIPVGTEVTVTFDFKAMGLDDQEVLGTRSLNGIKISGEGGGNTNVPRYYTSGSAVRIYKNNTLTISSETGAKIKSITFTISDGSLSYLSSNIGDLTETGWTGEAGSIVFTNTNSKQVRIQSIDVTYIQ